MFLMAPRLMSISTKPGRLSTFNSTRASGMRSVPRISTVVVPRERKLRMAPGASTWMACTPSLGGGGISCAVSARATPSRAGVNKRACIFIGVASR